MTEYDNLKYSYVSTVQFGLATGASYNESKRGNEILHKLCETIIDNSSYSDCDKQTMKNDLKVVKETLLEQIKAFYIK